MVKFAPLLSRHLRDGLPTLIVAFVSRMFKTISESKKSALSVPDTLLPETLTHRSLWRATPTPASTMMPAPNRWASRAGTPPLTTTVLLVMVAWSSSGASSIVASCPFSEMALALTRLMLLLSMKREHRAVLVLTHRDAVAVVGGTASRDGVVDHTCVRGLRVVVVQNQPGELRPKDLIGVDGVVDGAAAAAKELRSAAAERAAGVERAVLNRHDEHAGMGRRGRTRRSNHGIGVQGEVGVVDDQSEVRSQIGLASMPDSPNPAT